MQEKEKDMEQQQEQEQTLPLETDSLPKEKAPIEELPVDAISSWQQESSRQPDFMDVPPQRQWHSREMELFAQKPKNHMAQSMHPGTVPVQAVSPVEPISQKELFTERTVPRESPWMEPSVPDERSSTVQSAPQRSPFMGQPVFQQRSPFTQQPSPQGTPFAARSVPKNGPLIGQSVPPVYPQRQPQPMQQNLYQNSPPQYHGWQMPPQMPPQMPMPPAGVRQPLTPEKKDKRTAFWLKIVAGLIAFLIIYCIGSDIVSYRHRDVPTGAAPQSDNAKPADENRDSDGSKVVIQKQDKPELDPADENVNEDGTYTVEGVAAAVRPSIVEIFTYADTSEDLVSGTGSGIIVSEDGYIITNAHVLTGGKSFSVITADEEEYKAQVIGSDSKTDLAVIRIDGENLPAAVMGDSDEVVLGEAVIAIGNPAGLSGSVTNGIVSGLNRKIRTDSTGFDMTCIQTNAAISPGNSGGALVNMYGQVIGITSSKYVSSSYEGLGFAITINEALPIVEDLMDHGYVSDRVRIGITFISLESTYAQEEFADETGMKTVPEELMGIWVTEVAEDCDIADSKLRGNDVIVQMAGKDVMNYDAVCAAIEGKKAGDEVEALCRRYDADGTYEEFRITFQLMEDTSGKY